MHIIFIRRFTGARRRIYDFAVYFSLIHKIAPVTLEKTSVYAAFKIFQLVIVVDDFSAALMDIDYILLF